MLINESYGRDEVENFFDLSLRAGQVLDMLAARSEDEIIVVTHSVMIRAIVARVIMGKNASPDVIQHFQDNVKIHNTGVVSVIVLNDNGKIQYKVAFE
jgi:broad specificity phosphatase PhoE